MPRRKKNAGQPRLRQRTQKLRRRTKDVLDIDGNVVPKWKLKPIVKPDGVCTLPSGRRKYAFNTEEKATKALEHARHNREVQGFDHVEDRIYTECHGAPGAGVDMVHYHLTGQTLENYREAQRDRAKDA